MQQKVQFISTVLHDPDLLVMDEAFSGLDPVNSQILKDTVLELRWPRQDHPVLHAHHGAGGKALRPRLHHRARAQGGGRYAGRREAHARRRHLLVNFDGARGDGDRIFADPRMVSKADVSGQYAELELAAGADAQQILQALVSLARACHASSSPNPR